MTQKKLDFVIEDKTISRAEIRPGKVFIEDSFGKVVKVAKTGIIEKRIENRIITEIQKRTQSIDVPAIENEAISIVNSRLQNLHITDIDKETYSIAIAEECRKLIKSKVDNHFEFTKKSLLEIAKTSSNNIYHLSEVLENMQSKDSRRFEELYVSDDFSEIRKRNQVASFLPTLGEDYSLTGKDPDEKIIFTLNEDLLPYMVAPNKKSYGNKGFIIIYNDIIDNFEFTHSLAMYKIAADIEKIWQNFKISFIEAQARFGTKYGVKKKKTLTKVYINLATQVSSNKYQDKEKDIFSIKNEEGTKIALYSKTKKYKIFSDIHGGYFIKERLEKDRFGDPVYEEDENGNYVYEENYKSTYRFFKRDVLDKAIEELNMPNKSPFVIKLIEHRERGMKSTPIEYIQFQVTRKKNNAFNNMMKYGSLGYYSATRINFSNMDGGKENISNLDEYGAKLDESFDAGNFKKPILEISSLDELHQRVEKNYDAILSIKEILLTNAVELSHLSFNENHLVIFDTTTKRNKYGLHDRLGDDAAECLEKLLSVYGEIISQTMNRDGVEPILEFVPFEYYDDIKDRFVTITKKNFSEFRVQINTTIKHAQKKSFKKFRNREFKNKFYTLFFGE